MSSNRDNKKIVKNTMYLYLRMLVAMALGVYTSRLVLGTLGETDFGIYNVVAGISILLNFLNGTLVASAQRFLNMSLGQQTIDHTKNIFSASIRIHIGLSVIVLVAAESIGLWTVNHILTIPPDRMGAANIIYQTSILVVLFSIIQSPYQAMILAKEKMRFYAVISIIDLFLKFAFAYSLKYILFDNLIVYGGTMSFVSLVILLLYIFLCIKTFEECRGKYNVTDKTIYSKMLGFSGWAMIGSMAGMLLNQGINILLNIFLGPAVNAARALSMTLNNYVYSFVNNFTVAFSPQLIKLYASKEYEELSDLLIQSVKFSIYLFSIFAFPVLFETKFILGLWLKDIPAYTNVFCQLVILCSFVLCAERPMATVCNAIGCVKQVNLSVGLIYVLSFFVSWFLLALTNDVTTPFVVQIFTVIIGVLTFLYYIHRYVKINIYAFLYSIIYKPIVVLVVPAAILYLITENMAEGWLRFVVVGCVSTSTICICVYYWGLQTEERNKVITIIRNKICLRK